jgi:prophage DNA circulation protein
MAKDVREGAYTGPSSGTRRTFQFEDVSRMTPLRTQAFSFPGVDGDYVQQNGFGSRRYPLRVFFWGPLHDAQAQQFESLLLEPGRGKLEHPKYGTVRVVPYGEITRRDDLKTATNQTIVEVEFWTSLAELYPKAASDAENEILTGLDAAGLAACEQFQNAMDVSTIARRAAARGTLRGLLDSVSATIGQVSDLVSAVNRDFQDGVDLVNYAMDVLIGQPLDLALQIKDLMSAPSRALDGLKSRLDQYAALADRIFGSDAGQPAAVIALVAAATAGRFSLTERSARIANDFHSADLFATLAVSGMVASSLSVSNAEARGPRTRRFRTRPEVLRTAAAIGDAVDAQTAWRDAGFEALASIDKTGTYQQDDGEAQAQLRRAAALTQSHLIEVSFSVAPERAIVLDRPRTIVDLSAEVYGHVDPRDGFDPLDFLIESNGLSGDEILELPRGRKIVYYDAA